MIDCPFSTLARKPQDVNSFINVVDLVRENTHLYASGISVVTYVKPIEYCPLRVGCLGKFSTNNLYIFFSVMHSRKERCSERVSQ